MVANNLANEDLRQITDIVRNCQFHHENFSWCPPPLVKISLKFCRNIIYTQCYIEKHSVKEVHHHEIFSWWYKYSYNVLRLIALHNTRISISPREFLMVPPPIKKIHTLGNFFNFVCLTQCM